MDDLEYYRRRLSQEVEAAGNASCPAARERHEELAAAYRLRAHMVALPALASVPPISIDAEQVA